MAYEIPFTVYGDLSAAVTDSVFSSTSFEVDSNVSSQDQSGLDVVANLVISSSVYKQAFSVFSNDKSYGGPFLQQLKIIPYSHSVRDENFWDSVSNSFGGTSGFDLAVQDAFNVAVGEIRNLLADYYSFRNTLPSEQIQQMSEAGINSALTGEGISPSSLSSDGIVSETIPSQSQYTNDQLSTGITSFVSFIDSLVNLSSVGFSSANLMGLLDIAERDSLNKQELHDLMLSQLGISPSSDRTILNLADDTVQDFITSGSSRAKISAAIDSADSDALNKTYDIPNLSSPDPSGSIRLSGLQVLNQVSEFAMVSKLGEFYSSLNRSLRSAQYSDILSVLENESALSAANSEIAANEFNADSFNARNGFIEGINQTTLSSRLSELKRLEIVQKEFDEMLSHYRQQVLGSWGRQINEHPHLSPFFYKALFDFGMSDTFYHQSLLGQGLKYGLENLNGISQLVGNIIGFKKPAKVPSVRTTRSRSTVSGPKGETVTESLSETIID